MNKSLILSGLALGIVAAGPAMAECDTAQEAVVGQAISQLIVEKLPVAYTNESPAIDILTCEGGGRKFESKFRYSFVYDGKVRWVEGRVQGIDDHITAAKFYRYSPGWRSGSDLALLN